MKVLMLRNPAIDLGFPEECKEGATVDVSAAVAKKLVAKKLAVVPGEKVTPPDEDAANEPPTGEVKKK